MYNAIKLDLKTNLTFWRFLLSGYYGISMSTTGLSDNIYVAFILSALVELPAYFACIVLMDHWGRKPTLCLVLFIAGVFCIPAGYASGTLQTVLVLLGIIIHLLTIIMRIYRTICL